MLIIPGNDQAAIKVRSEDQLTQVTDRLKREKAKNKKKKKSPSKTETEGGNEAVGGKAGLGDVEGKLKDLLSALVDDENSNDEDDGEDNDTDGEDKDDNENDDAELLLKVIDKLAKIKKKRQRRLSKKSSEGKSRNIESLVDDEVKMDDEDEEVDNGTKEENVDDSDQSL